MVQGTGIRLQHLKHSHVKYNQRIFIKNIPKKDAKATRNKITKLRLRIQFTQKDRNSELSDVPILRWLGNNPYFPVQKAVARLNLVYSEVNSSYLGVN